MFSSSSEDFTIESYVRVAQSGKELGNWFRAQHTCSSALTIAVRVQYLALRRVTLLT